MSLIIPDLHHRWRDAETIIEKVAHDEVIFLGDYFDDFNDTPHMVSETCDWLISSVNKPNRIHLFGNHDVHYAFVYRTLQCSGYEQWKYFIISDVVPRETWDKLKWYHVLDNKWLLTHAGLHNAHITEPIRVLNGKEKLISIASDLDIGIINGFRAAANNGENWALGSGRSRGGRMPFGGIIWCDFEREFVPVKGLHQIFGHTPQGLGIAKWCVLNKNGKKEFHPSTLFTPKEFDDPSWSFNLDLDVLHNTHYAVWDGRSLTVGNVKDLR